MRKAKQKGGGHDCMDAGGRVTQDAVTEGPVIKKARYSSGLFYKKWNWGSTWL